MSVLRVFVSAGARGIGRTLADAFLASGACVSVCDVDATALDDFRKAYPNQIALQADVADPAAVDSVFDSLERAHDGLDVLINNAGIAGPTARVEDVAVADWQRTIAVDLNGVFYCTRRAVPLLRRSANASIVNMASNAGLFGLPLRSPYTAAKWAIVGLTKTWAMELGPEGIRVNAICPGSVEGPRIRGVIARDAAARGLSDEQVTTEYQRQSSLRSFVEAEDVAALACFLTSSAGRRISGQAIGLDGHTEGLWSDLPPPG